MITSQPFGIKIPPDFFPKPFNPLVPLPYAAKGVQFPGLSQNNPVYLVNNSMPTSNAQAEGSGDNGRYSFSFWAQNLTPVNNVGAVVFVHNPAAPNVFSYSPFFGTVGDGPNSVVLQMNLELGSPGVPATLFGYWNSYYSQLPFSITDTNWHHYLGSFLTLRGSGSKIGVLYIDDVLQSPSVVGSLFPPPAQTDNGTPSFATIMGGLPCYIGGDGTAFAGKTFALSDVWLAPGYTLLDIDLSNSKEILAPRISPADRRIFTTVFPGGTIMPNDPQLFPLSAVLLTGGASVFGSNGLGFGGPFALVGSAPLSDVPGPPRPV